MKLDKSNGLNEINDTIKRMFKILRDHVKGLGFLEIRKSMFPI
jgi:hypothetical protein